MLIRRTLDNFLDETASHSPAPGGGSISALCASLSAALTSMVCRLTIGKKKYAEVEPEMKETLEKSEELRSAFQSLIDADTDAFHAVMNAFGLPKDTDEQKRVRSESIEAATKKATMVPMDLLRKCAQAIPLVQTVASKGNMNSLSDVGVAALALGTAALGASLNVYINLGGLKDTAFVENVRTETARLEGQVRSACEEVYAGVRRRLAP